MTIPPPLAAFHSAVNTDDDDVDLGDVAAGPVLLGIATDTETDSLSSPLSLGSPDPLEPTPQLPGLLLDRHHHHHHRPGAQRPDDPPGAPSTSPAADVLLDRLLVLQPDAELEPPHAPTPTTPTTAAACRPTTAPTPVSMPRTTPAALTADERRRRRNEKERLRVRGVKDRIQKLRQDMAALTARHDALRAELTRRAVARGSVAGEEAARLRQYLELVEETDHLAREKVSLEDQLRPRVLQATALKTMTHVDGDFHATADYLLAYEDDSLDDLEAMLIAYTPPPTRSAFVGLDPMSIFEHVLFNRPLVADEARRLVQETCLEMMDALGRDDWQDGGEAFGWRGGRVVDDSVLQFKLTQQFQGTGADALMLRTWELLTNGREYRRIQPETTQHKVLQRINDECWVVGITVQGHRVRHTVVLVARALVHGGYLITFRSIPISRVHQEFVEKETGGIYATIKSWYNFQEHPAADGRGGLDCDVIFGGTARNGDTRYLHQLKLELLSGITRWQSAVGFSQFTFGQVLPSAPCNGYGHDD